MSATAIKHMMQQNPHCMGILSVDGKIVQNPAHMGLLSIDNQVRRVNPIGFGNVTETAKDIGAKVIDIAKAPVLPALGAMGTVAGLFVIYRGYQVLVNKEKFLPKIPLLQNPTPHQKRAKKVMNLYHSGQAKSLKAAWKMV